MFFGGPAEDRKIKVGNKGAISPSSKRHARPNMPSQREEKRHCDGLLELVSVGASRGYSANREKEDSEQSRKRRKWQRPSTDAEMHSY